ncbi:DNA adenine methylase [Candidatus Woesearchaeota archaeon]|nr:DNA adenine methylase [Candidatus Woesearchaeota archaeon]
MTIQIDLFGRKYRTNRFPKTQYLGSKEQFVNWIFEIAPKNIETFFDAFSGTSVVGYHFKSRDYEIYSNDFLKCNYLIAKALIENNNVKLEKKDVNILLNENIESHNLIESVFTNIFFEKNQAQFLDKFRTNVEKLDNEYKKALALALMNRALTRKVTLGHFAHLSAIKYSKNPNRVKRNPSLIRHLKDIFLNLIDSYNNAIFDNGKNNKAFCENTITLIPKLKHIDLVYFDPPYCGCHPDYQAFYHFLETYVEYWKDKKFVNDTKMYYPKRESGFVLKTEIKQSFQKLFENSQHIPYWLISYNNKSIPKKGEMIEMIEQYRSVKVYEYEYKNHYGGKGSRKGTKEYLFYCYN